MASRPELHANNSDEIQLHDFEANRSNEDLSFALPRADGGKQAWLALAGAFTLEYVVWGFPFAFGIFQEYFRTHEPFSKEPAGIAAISTTASGIMYLSSPLVAVAIKRWPHIRRPSGVIGLGVMIAALLGASFSNTTGALIATQGVLYGLGGMTLYFPCMYVIDEWFIARKGLAFGVVWSGTGTAGATVPFLAQWLLDTYGFRTALRVWMIIMTVLSTPAFLVMKNRIPPTSTNNFAPMDFSFIKRAPFWVFQFSNFMQGLAFFLPQLWIPSFAASLGLPSISGPLALCFLNIAACIGYLGHGFLVDRFNITIVVLLSTLTSSFSIFLLWGFTTSQAMLYVFSIIWGVSGGGYAATWSGKAMAMGQELRKHRHDEYTTVDTGLVIGLLCVSKGIASLISGPISEELLNLHTSGKFAYGGQYGAIIVFAGVTALMGSTACFMKPLKVL